MALSLHGLRIKSLVRSFVQLPYYLLLFLFLTFFARAEQFSVELLDENDGFNTSIVFSMVQDQQGFLWFGTAYDGIMRYDGKNVVNFRRNGSPQYPLRYNENGNLLLAQNGQIWIGGWGSSVSMLDPVTNQVTYFTHVENDPNTVSDAYIQSLFQDDAGNIWFGARSRGLSRFDPETKLFERFPHDLPIASGSGPGTSNGRVWTMTQVASNELWIGTENGLNRLDMESKEFQYFIPDPELGPTGVNKIRRIHALSEQEFILGTHDGVLIFDRTDNSFRRVAVEQDVTLGPIYSMLDTSFDEIWVTTGKGVYSFSEKDPVMRKVPLDFDDTCALTLFQDKQNIIWISCEGSGIYKLVPQTFFKTLDHPIAQTAYALKMANDGNLLIGTEGDGIYEWDWRNDVLSSFAKIRDKNPPSVNRLMQDDQGLIWFTDKYYLYQIDAQGRFLTITPPQGTPNAEGFTDFHHILEASDGRIWLGTAYGVYVINSLNEPFTYYGFNESENTSLTSSNIAEIYEDRQGRIWIGTQSGLNLWLPESDSFQRFYLPNQRESESTSGVIHAIYQDEQLRVWIGSRDGLLLVDEFTRDLIPKGSGDFSGSLGVRIIKGDNLGNIWMVTQVGVLKYNPINDELRSFDERDGLSGARYFVNLATQSDSGTIFISSRSGIHYFDPSLITEDPLTSNTVLTHFEVLGDQDFDFRDVVRTNSVSLAPDENYLRFDFSTLDLLNARQIRYRYKLEGLDEQWIDNGIRNTVVYSNLRGGEYRFRVQPVIKNDLLYKNELVVNISIATPLWRQPWVLALYVIVVLMLIGYYVKYRQVRHEQEIARQKRFVSELELQVVEKTREIQQESNKLAEANKVKSQFLANMSHEIRTPLTAIIGLSESIIQGDVESKDIKGEVDRIHNQSRHLMSLLNDILDVTKIEENKLELEPYDLDISAFLSEVNDLFISQAMAKGIQFSIVPQLPKNLNLHVDGLRLKQVLINLISNAIKFTEQGQVTIIVSMQDANLLINVVDTGIGMSDEQLEKVFEFFTQADNSINRRFGGSGLGLALSQKLVSMMGGEMQVKSELNKGSIFTFSVPVTVSLRDTFEKIHTASTESASSIQGTVLLAEDQPDIRRLIARLLRRLGLNVVTADDGAEAIERYKETNPQLILLDIQMPIKDGIQAYQELRAMGATQPIIAVTANAMKHEIAKYKDIGFDEHLSKPIVRQQLIDIIYRYFETNSDTESAHEVLQETKSQDLRDDFIARLRNEIEQFESAREQHDKIRDLAHRIAGAAELLGFKELASIACQLENACKERSEAIPEMLDQLLEQMKSYLP